MERFGAILAQHGLLAGQVLLTPHDFGMRTQYLHARETLRRLLDLGVVPVVNENDTVADDEIRYGDNDRLAALVSHLVGADVLVLLTDTAGPLHRRSPPRRRRVADRGDRRGRRRARGAGGRHRHRPGERRDGHEAGGGEDRRVVGGAGRDRRGRRPRRRPRRDGGAGGRHGRPAPGGTAPEPEAVDRVRPGGRRAGRGRRRRPPRTVFGQPLPAAGRGPGRRGCVRGRRRGRDRRRHWACRSRKGWSGTPRPCCGASPGARPPSCPTGCRTRSCTATTSSCCPDPRNLAAPALARAPWFRHTLASRARRRPAGGESSPEGFDGRRGAGGR